ncbi:hypothetical protein [Sulfurimonas xiamenensis]|uniref:Uncharacterized protein n=1 Tax=Sulfurimonas xiamenensis TaxID=2590021 RepID=A0AAJ4A4L6_9BACT|nr:hypothetical protein [Sulfurimonas xiamenensis]QFR43757.1 hypothetical protein FJR47_07475 [Sulfurimonas xiamenensis]
MSDYWYTDEYGRKRHVQDGVSSDSARYRHESIYNPFYAHSDFSKDSYLYLTSCPKCFEAVYYCNCSNGGRVFFDSLAPDWDKHPCTSTATYQPKNIDEKYSLIIPTHNYYQRHEDYERRSTTFEVPSFLKSIKINTTDDILYKNLTQNTMILVRESNGRFYLTIIVTTKKFKNHHLCNNKRFNNQYIMQEYIISLLSKVDFTQSVDISNEVMHTKGNKKIIKLDKFQSITINKNQKKAKKPSKKNVIKKNKIKQEFKPVEQKVYVSKKTGLKIVKKKNTDIINETTENVSVESLEENEWKIVK